VSAQNFNFAPKFSQNVGFSSEFCIFERKFSDKKEKKIFRQFSDGPKFRGQLSPASSATTPLFASTVCPQSYALREHRVVAALDLPQNFYRPAGVAL